MTNPFESGLEADFTLETDRGGIIDEPPFRILMMGDWSGDAGRRPIEERRPIEIDRDNFDDVIERLGVRLELVNGSRPLEFARLDDFHPDEIVRRLPVFAELRDLRKRLKDESTFNQAAREVRSWSNGGSETADRPAEPARQPSGSLLDAILSEPAGGAPPPRQGARGELADLVSDLVRPHLVSVDEGEQKQLIAAVDEATSGLMRTILHHRSFRQLEASWRGLFLQVRRVETASDLKIYILDITKDELAADLKSGNLKDSAIYKVLFETADDEPWSLTCGDYAFSPVVDDIAALARIAKLASAARAPFVSHVRPDIFGVHSLAEQPDPHVWEMSTNFDAGALWATLRGLPEAQYLGMAMPRVLARLPYGADTEPLESFSFEEFTGTPKHDDYVWSNGCFAVAMLMAQSYSAYGWEMGRSLMQDIEGLPLHVYKEGTETVFTPCAEILMTQNGVDRLMNYGLMPLISYKNTDHVKLARFQSVADPVTGLKGRWS